MKLGPNTKDSQLPDLGRNIEILFITIDFDKIYFSSNINSKERNYRIERILISNKKEFKEKMTTSVDSALKGNFIPLSNANSDEYC